MPLLSRLADILRACALLTLLLASICGDSLAQSEVQVAEYKVKAAVLYRFMNYVEWPPKAFPGGDSPLIVGALAADLLAQELKDVVAGRTVEGRPIAVRQLRAGDSFAGLHVLYIGRSEAARTASVLASVKGQPLLTITETDEAFALGSVMHLFVLNDQVRFDIALPQAAQAQLKISARLLPLARKVIGGRS